MAEDARLAYLQARLQARHGDRPSPDDWRVAEASADLSHFLDALRRTPLKRWVGDINHEMPSEVLERHFRATWREAIDEVAHWAPPDWQPATAWLRWLPDLPAIQHLLRGHKVPPWMRADPVMRELAFDEPQRRREALAEGPLAPLAVEGEAIPPGTSASAAQAEPLQHAPPVTDNWLAEWRRRLPKNAGGHREELEAILEQVLAHIEAMRGSEEPHGRALRSLLKTRLARRFRQGAGTVIALFTHLVIDGLELERVRAGVMSRRLLPERSEGRSWA